MNIKRKNNTHTTYTKRWKEWKDRNGKEQQNEQTSWEKDEKCVYDYDVCLCLNWSKNNHITRGKDKALETKSRGKKKRNEFFLHTFFFLFLIFRHYQKSLCSFGCFRRINASSGGLKIFFFFNFCTSFSLNIAG